MNHWSKWSQYKAYNMAYHNSEQVYELGLEPVVIMITNVHSVSELSPVGWFCMGCEVFMVAYLWEWPTGSMNPYSACAGSLRYKIDRWSIGHSKSIQRMRLRFLISLASYFLFVRVGTNKLVGRLAETLVNQSLYTGLNGLLPFPFRYILPRYNWLVSRSRVHFLK